MAARIAPVERRWLLKEKDYIMVELLMGAATPVRSHLTASLVLFAVLLPIGKLNLVLGALYVVSLVRLKDTCTN